MLCWLDCEVFRPGAFLLPVALMLGWMGVVELLEIFNKRGRMPLSWAMFSGVLITVLFAGLEVLWPEAVSSNVPGQLGWMAIGLIVGLYLALYRRIAALRHQVAHDDQLGARIIFDFVSGRRVRFHCATALLDFEPKHPVWAGELERTVRYARPRFIDYDRKDERRRPIRHRPAHRAPQARADDQPRQNLGGCGRRFVVCRRRCVFGFWLGGAVHHGYAERADPFLQRYLAAWSALPFTPSSLRRPVFWATCPNRC